MAKKKKKMTPAQAAAARRPDDYVSPQATQSPKKPKTYSVDSSTYRKAIKSSTSWKMALPIVIAALVLAIIAPFFVYFASNLLHLPGA